MVSPLWAVAHPIDSLKVLVPTAKHDTTAVRLYTQIADKFFEQKQNDSALYYYNLALTKVKPQFEQIYNPNIYYKLNLLFYNSGSYSTAIDYLFKTLAFYDDIRRTPHDTVQVNLEVAKLYIHMGRAYFSLTNYTKAIEAFEKSYNLTVPIAQNSTDPEISKQLFIATFNMGSANLSLKNYQKARKYFENALSLNERIGNIEYDAVLYNHLGIVFDSENTLPKAKEYYEKSIAFREVLKDTSGLAQVFNNLGRLEYARGNYNSAVHNLNKALEYSQKGGNLKSEMLAADMLSKTYEKQNKHIQALQMHKLFKQLTDSLNNSNQLEKAARLELQYLHDRQVKDMAFNQQIELAKRERQALIYLIIAGIFLFTLIVLHLMNRNKATKIKQVKAEKERLELEQEKLSLEKENLTLDLEHKNKELTTNVMYLLNKNELLTSISEKLFAIRHKLLPENKPIVQEILHELEKNIDNTIWDEFEVRFQNVQQDFYKRLYEKHPNLTPNEIKLCAFLKLNMTTKDISSITLQSVKSIEVARTRLRKKMGINRDENLIQLLQEL